MLDLLIAESPSDIQIKNSLNGFVHRVQRYLWRMEVTDFAYDEQRLSKCHALSMHLLHRYINPSCFKAAAALTISASATRPFEVTLPSVPFGPIADFPSAFFAILESAYWMHGAELLVAPKDVRKLSEPIMFSDHFFEELVLTTGRTGTHVDPELMHAIPETYWLHLRSLALIYEALAYQRNGICKYAPPENLRLEVYQNILA
jgi:hypothetical protein